MNGVIKPISIILMVALATSLAGCAGETRFTELNSVKLECIGEKGVQKFEFLVSPGFDEVSTEDLAECLMLEWKDEDEVISFIFDNRDIARLYLSKWDNLAEMSKAELDALVDTAFTHLNAKYWKDTHIDRHWLEMLSHDTENRTIEKLELPLDGKEAVSPPTERPETRTEFFITIDTSLTGNKLVVSGETNLPDDSELGIYVDRLYKTEVAIPSSDKYGDWRVICLGPRSYTVKDGKYSESWRLSDKNWYQTVTGWSDEIGAITEIKDEFMVSVIFTPIKWQPDSVYGVVGRNGEKLNGRQVREVEHLGETFYLLEATAEVYFPFTLE